MLGKVWFKLFSEPPWVSLRQLLGHPYAFSLPHRAVVMIPKTWPYNLQLRAPWETEEGMQQQQKKNREGER